MFKDEIAVVYPTSVGLFTGNYDVNGNKIFDNDIIETFSFECTYRQIGNYPPPNVECEEWDIYRDVCYGDTCDGCEIDYSEEEKKYYWEIAYTDEIKEKYPYLTIHYINNLHIIGNDFENNIDDFRENE